MKIKKGDVVAVITGKDKPVNGVYKTGEVLKVSPATNRVVVKGINIATKHYRPSNARPEGGIEKLEAPILLRNNQQEFVMNMKKTLMATLLKMLKVKKLNIV